MNVYAIIMYKDGVRKLIKSITLNETRVITIEAASKAEEALYFDTQEKTCYVLDMIAALQPELEIAPIIVEAKEKED